MKRIAMMAVAGMFLVFSATAQAKGKGGTPQNHTCMKDGAEVAGKTKKECIKDGGKWEKMAAPAPAAPAPAAK